jgi:YcxB-like protein
VQNLTLEYACTEAERREAEELNLHRQLGRGSKWRTFLILFVMLGGMLLALYFKIARDVSPARRPYVFAALLVLCFVIVLWRRRARGDRPVPIRLEISENEVAIHSSESKVTVPWSAFGQVLESPNLFVLLDRPKGILWILPKRAFPDQTSQSWFRNLSGNRCGQVVAPATEAPRAAPAASADRITLQFQLRFRDYLDRTIASRRTWGMILACVAILLGAFFYAAAHPPPRPVYSATQVFFMAVPPFVLVMATMVVMLTSIYHWRAHTQYLVPQELVLSNEGIAFASRHESGILAWTIYPRFKETRWSFILWEPRGSAWLLLPKRSFASIDDLRRCEALLTTHLHRSPWFFG